MRIIKSSQEIQNITKKIDTTIGFVPTMGALHDGHISLIKQAKEQNSVVVVSIFVNPTQFNSRQDLEKYPKKDEADIKICEFLEVEYLFMPHFGDIYFRDDIKILAPAIASYKLEGEFRPKHFDGVLQVVLKLFNLTNPTNAYFGKKDAQQLLLIESMVQNLFLDIDIVRCETLRDRDGLAYSSRNILLSKEQKKEALVLPKALATAFANIRDGKIEADKIEADIVKTLRGVDIEYVSIVDRNLQKVDKVESKSTIILCAINIGGIRLIDNIWV
jgi:pantoate--beta-alanine ligase